MKRQIVFSLCFISLLTAFGASAHAQQEITYWVWGWAPEMLEGIHKAVDLFEQANPGMKVNTRVGVSVDQLVTATAAGVPPDLVVVSTSIYEALLGLNALEALNERFAETNLWEEELLPGLDQTVVYKGVEYAVPGAAVYPLDGLVWNKTMFAEAGLTPLNPNVAITWEELAEQAQKLVRRSAEGDLERLGYHPLEGRNSNPDVLETYFDLNLYRNGTPSLNTPEVADALGFLNNEFILRQGRGHDEIMDFSSGGWYLIGQRLTAIANLGAYAPAELRSRAPEHEFGVTWHPTWNGDKKQQIVTFRHIIPKGADNVDAAWELAKFLATSTEAQAYIFDSTGFFGPSRRFVSEHHFDDPMTRWYMASMSDAESLNFELPFRYGEGIPGATEHLHAAKLRVLQEQEAPVIALEQANVSWRAAIARALEE